MLIIMYTSCIWFLLLITGTGIDASPCSKVIKKVEYYEVVKCTCRLWGECTHYATLWRYRSSYRRTCCAGYGGSNCQPRCSRSCNSRGSCVAPNVCHCWSGYTGSSCQTPVCSPGCQNGYCRRPGVCSCYSGYTGSRCQTPTCNPDCQNGGSCVSPNTCKCQAGMYTGPRCNAPICTPSCKNGGICSQSRQCQCPNTYQGRDCGDPVCRPSCRFGTCIRPNVCYCYPGYTGSLCETPICSPVCKNGGTCVSPNTCSCPNGMYSGLRCNEPICDPSCKNGGTCSELRECVCPSTHRGRECEIPVCSPNCKSGSCKGPDFCSCYPGYTGRLCETPICNPVCQNGGTCVSPNKCDCPAGRFTGPGCNIPICNPSCNNGGTCSQSRQCVCPSTYQGRDCGVPVCKSHCRNGGTCIYPDVCSCDETYTGRLCEIPKCSYHSPCFPGTCGGDSVTCHCYRGFSGQDGIQRCRELTSERRPTITQCTSVLANIERTGHKRELYRFITDSSEPNSTRVDTLWLNQKDYNYINVTFAAFYTGPENLAVPEYVKRFKFGITSGKIQIELWKVDRDNQNKPFVSQNEIKNCSYQPGSLDPNDDVFQCNFTDENFDRLLENGDTLTLTVIAENGGYRELEGPGTQLKNDFFIGQSTTKSTMFRFDFKKPCHCLQERNCTKKALDVTEDITKFPITLIWNNWMDDLSGLKEYKLQVYLLKLNTTYLSEPYPWNPSQEITFNKTVSSYIYTPPQPGMYSFILNVIDNANNTQYARTLVLYDPSSSITLSTSPFIATSAEPETNYMWQNNLKNNITVSWKGHFENKFHDTNKLLNQVSHYQHFDHITKYEKQVPQQLDDKTGNRTLQPIQNIHGIVKFDYFFRNENQGNTTPESSWIPVENVFSESQTFCIERQDGNAINFWVRATDVMGNGKVDMTKIFFDSTPPKALADSDVKFTRNTKSPTYAFSSRLQVDAYDRHSGIYKVHLELLANSSNELFHGTNIQGNKSDIDVRKEGYQLPMGDYYYYSHFIDINNCWMVVSKEKFADEFVLLNLTVYNNAMITTHYSKTITDLVSLDGIDEYTGPKNLTVLETYDNSVRLKWIVSPTCYKRSKITLQFRSSNGRTENRFIDKDADWVDLTGLNPETSYNLSFITEYGRHKSDPVFLHFKTNKPRPAFTVAAIAGMSSGFFILVAIIVGMVVLWRLGRLSVVREDIRRRATVVRRNITNRFSANPNHDVDDIYIYGQMELSNTDRWILPSSEIVLDALLTSGRFADIYKARYQKQNNKAKQIVIAKTLKSGYTEENMLMMRAKINFFGKEVGEHPNIIHFIGAVIDNDAFGPYMVFEYCTKGQLRDWLLQQRNESTDDTVESLYRIIYGISKGMFYLETKKLVHRRLAARNVLLTDELEPQIYGFGPEPPKHQGGEEDGDGTSEDKERIPVKWTAPECCTSMKAASIKSDVWSFGVVLWEVFSLGETPYPGLRSRDVITQVRNGHRMKRPEFANDFFHDIMTRCWNTKSRRRPSFKDISTDIGKTFNAAPSDEYYYYREK